MIYHLKYMIASSPGHYAAAQRLMRHEGMDKSSLSFPTIMAWEGDELVGVCGTRIIDKMIVAGPLVMKSGRRRLFTIMRLVEAYETAMSQLGITTYIFSAERGSILHKGIERYFPDLKPYASEGGCDFYTWKVKSYGWRRQGTRSVAGRTGPTAEPSGAVGAAATDH